MYYKVLLFTLVCLLKTLSAEDLKVGEKELYQTKKHIKYTLAYDLNETPLDLTSREWFNSKESFNTFENANRAYWLKFNIENTTGKRQEYYLQSENQFTYSITFFELKDGQIVEVLKDGVIHKNQHREFNVNHILFPISLAPYERAELFLKIRNYNKIDIKFLLRTKESLLDFYQTYNLIEGLFFGGMLIMILYNLFLYFLLKFRPYLYYVSYTFWLMVYFFGLFGFSQRYFPDYHWMFYISSGAFFISMTLFIQSILNLKEKLNSIHKILNMFIGYFILSTFLNIYVLEAKEFLYAQILFDVLFAVIPFYAFIIISTTYYLAYFKNDSIAKIYSWVWTLVSFVGLFLPLVYLNIIETEIPSDYIFQFLILFEVVCFSYILAYKIKIIEKEKKKQEGLLVQQNKLASMGEMISMIAHQWRQPLSEINGIVLNIDVDMRRERLDKDRVNQHLNEIEKVTEYLSHTINDFMNFFKHDKSINEFSLSTAIKRATNLLHSSQGYNIEIFNSSSLDIKLCSYQSELIQALLIIMNNSMDAAKQRKIPKGKIVIDTYQFEDKVCIVISDNLGGIPSSIIDKVFNPYFTTKHKSKGTGLGLYILKILVEKSMKGSVSIQNRLEGVECTISIPVNISGSQELLKKEKNHY